MQATTYGEIHKNDVYLISKMGDFLLQEKDDLNFFNKKSCLYSNKTTIRNESLNYLNRLPENKLDASIKNLILKEFNDCENMYPFLGDMFLQVFLNKSKIKKTKKFKFNKSFEKKFLDSIDNHDVFHLAEWLLNNINLSRNISVETIKEEKNILLEVIDNFQFQFEYDFDYFKNNAGLKISNYKFIIIDGMIDTMGEIHHLMHNASLNKMPHVIFCHGVSDEVKYNILKNNSEGRTQVLPVNINYNENTLNVLNDLAVLHNTSVVSSQLGQTISQESRKELPSGREICFFKNRLSIAGEIDDKTVRLHRNFLRDRIHDAKMKGDVDIDVLKNRLKNFSTKTLKIYLPESMKLDNSVSRELDYALRVMSNFEKEFISLDLNFKKNYFVPTVYKNFVDQKVNSLQNIIYNIKAIII